MTDSITFRKGTETFRPRARLVSVLGEQLIRDATVGLLELVKNGYDADADTVTVKLLNLSIDDQEKSRLLKAHNVPKNQEKNFLDDHIRKHTVIVVEDDGYGMDLDTILYKWLEPATGHKETAKEKGQPTPKGRLPLGEKGVGRFAAHKLGHKLILISRARDEKDILGSEEVVVTIDWDKFDDPDIYLSDVTINYEIRKPQHFISNSGTYMEIQHARTRWNESDVFRISRALRRLMSPFRTPQSFIIKLECPEYPKYTDLDPGELLRTSHAQMTVLVDRSGVAQYDYKFDLEPYPSRKVESQEIDLRKKMKNWDPVDRNSASGEFFVTLYLWDRRSDSLKLSKANPDELNQAFGVSVFRDGIRVMPYGEPDDDWLGIDERRYMRSSGAFGRKNVLGAIEITQIANKNLRDKSNREGFIENDAFIDLRDLMRAIMNIAFNEFAEDRRVIKATEDANKVILPAIRSLENSANSVTETLDQNRLVIQDFVSRGKLDSLIAEQLLANLNPVDNTFKAAVNETRQAAIDTLTTFDEERDMLLSLAGLGLAAERFTHEFARLTREAVDLLREVKRIPQIQQSVEATNSINTLRVTIEALQDLVLALGPMFYIRRRTKEKELNVKIIVEHALLLNEGQIEDNKIKVELDQQDELVAVMRVGALTQVFNNLIDNACYWLSRKSQENDRCLKITIVAKDKMVIIADNGPGIHPRDRHRIFDPFFSTKVDGRGLGLFISREILAESKAIIELLEPGNHPATFRVGAAFCIRFAD